MPDPTFDPALVDALARALAARHDRADPFDESRPFYATSVAARFRLVYRADAIAGLVALVAVDALVTPDHDRQVRAQELRDYADRHHGGVEGVQYPTDYGTGVEHDAGLRWLRRERGRGRLLHGTGAVARRCHRIGGQ